LLAILRSCAVMRKLASRRLSYKCR